MGALSNKGGRGQRNREEIGAEATRGFAARSRALRARISRLRRSCARLNKTAMLRRLGQGRKLIPRDFFLCEPQHLVTEVGMRPETQKQQTAANSRIKTSAVSKTGPGRRRKSSLHQLRRECERSQRSMRKQQSFN